MLALVKGDYPVWKLERILEFLVKYSGIFALIVSVSGSIILFSNGLGAAQGKISSLEDRAKLAEINVDQIRASLNDYAKSISSLESRSSVLETKAIVSQSREAEMFVAIYDEQKYAASLDNKLQRLEASLTAIAPVVVELSKRPVATIDPRQQQCAKFASEFATGWTDNGMGFSSSLTAQEKSDRLIAMAQNGCKTK